MSQSPIFITTNHDGESSEEERTIQRERIRETFSSLALADEAELLEHGSIRVPELESSIISKWPGFDQGEWWVQDPSASLPALALYNTLVIQDERKPRELHVVDLCSAPGGKTAQLCSLGFGKVTAVEVSSRRTKPLKDNLERLGMMERCEIVISDGREWKPNEDHRVDAVLLDAPCSATGVGSRRPDVLQKSPDLKEITKLQRELAVHAVDNLLKPGGVMVYATCSLLKSESEDQMQWLLAREDGPKIEVIPFEPGELGGFDEAIDENGWLRIIPGHLPGSLSYCDGFFVARIRRME
jgi:16S rRNA (cytosine967-C5)-methyltransferase